MLTLIMYKQRSVRGKKTSSRNEEQVQKLLNWAAHEMRLNEDQLPSLEDMKMLLKGRFAESTWEYITGHILTSSVVENMRQNLHLHSGALSSEQAMIMAERAELMREVASLQLAVSQTAEDSSRLENDIISLEATNSLTRSELSELSRKSTLLSAHSVKCQEVVNVLKEFSKRIQQREELFMYTERETSYFTRGPLPGTAVHGTEPVLLETACKREVRIVCNQVEELVRLISVGEKERATVQLERIREQTWSKVEALLSTYPPHDVLQSLIELTQEISEHVHSETEDIDIKRDAQQLQYQSSHPIGRHAPNLLQSVEDHLMQAQLAQVNRSLDCERVQAAADDMQVSLNKVKGQIEEYLERRYHDYPEGRELASTNVQLDLEVCGLEGALSVLSQYISSLQSSQLEKRKALEILEEKKKQIEGFTNTADSHQTQIQELVKHNSSARGRLQKQHTELSLYIRDRVCGHKVQLVSGARSLLDSVQAEVQLFSCISLARATKTPGLNVQSNDLSIHCLHPYQPSGSSNWQELTAAIGLHPYSSPEGICRGIVNFLTKVEQSAKEVEELERGLAGMKTLSKDNHKAQGVVTACQHYDRQLQEEGIPLVRLSLSKASQGLARCSSVEKTMKEWWEQPSQHCVPWVTYDGMSCDKWVEQWKVLTAKLRQLSSQN